MEGARQSGVQLYQKATHESAFNDTNYIFLTFVTRYFPAGVIGLVIAVIMNAAMSSSSGELNSLAAVSVMDLYRRLFRPDETDRHYLIVSRVCTAIWGAWAVIFAQFAKNLGSLVESGEPGWIVFLSRAAGRIHPGVLFPASAGGGAAFWAMLTGEAVIVGCSLFTHVAFLWFNVIGAVVVVLAGWLLSMTAGQPPAQAFCTFRALLRAPSTYNRTMMKLSALLALALGAMSAIPADAQLASPNGAGVAMGHLHLFVRDVDANRRFLISCWGKEQRKATACI